MYIAVLSDKPELDGVVSDVFEESPWLIIVETDRSEIILSKKNADPVDSAKCIVENDCEAIVCGTYVSKECFSIVSEAQVTRYEGKGLNVLEAAKSADLGILPLIVEYEGGPGCTPGGGNCEEANH